MLLLELRTIVYRYAFGTDHRARDFDHDIAFCAAVQRAVPPMFLNPLAPRNNRYDSQHMRPCNPYRRNMPYTPTWTLNLLDPWSYLPDAISNHIDSQTAFAMRTYKAVVKRWTNRLRKEGIEGWNHYHTRLLSRLRLEYFIDLPCCWFREEFFTRLAESSTLPS